MKPSVRHSRNVFYIILLIIGLALFAITVSVVIKLIIAMIITNDSTVLEYNWDDIFSLAISSFLIFLISIKRIRKNRSLGNKDAFIIWRISFLLVGALCFYSLGIVSYKSVRKYINRDKQGNMIKLSAKKIIDSALLANSINQKADSLTTEWQTIVSKPGNFSIQFPNFTIKKEVITELIDGERLPIHSLSLNTQDKTDSNLAYAVSFFPLKKGEATDTFFDRERKSLLSKTNGTLEYEDIIDSLGYPCRDLYIIIDQKKLKATCRLIYNQNNFFVLTVLTRDGNLFNKRIYHFINSLTFLPPTNESK